MPYVPGQDLRGKHPRQTYDKLVTTDGTKLYDGLGSELTSITSSSATASIFISGSWTSRSAVAYGLQSNTTLQFNNIFITNNGSGFTAHDYGGSDSDVIVVDNENVYIPYLTVADNLYFIDNNNKIGVNPNNFTIQTEAGGTYYIGNVGGNFGFHGNLFGTASVASRSLSATSASFASRSLVSTSGSWVSRSAVAYGVANNTPLSFDSTVIANNGAGGINVHDYGSDENAFYTQYENMFITNPTILSGVIKFLDDTNSITANANNFTIQTEAGGTYYIGNVGGLAGFHGNLFGTASVASQSLSATSASFASRSLVATSGSWASASLTSVSASFASKSLVSNSGSWTSRSAVAYGVEANTSLYFNSNILESYIGGCRLRDNGGSGNDAFRIQGDSMYIGSLVVGGIIAFTDTYTDIIISDGNKFTITNNLGGTYYIGNVGGNLGFHGNLFGTASQVITSSYAKSASWAPPGVGVGTTLETASIYQITSSWSQRSLTSISSSFASSSMTASLARTASHFTGSNIISINITASVITASSFTGSFNGGHIGATIGTASWSNYTTSASYASFPPLISSNTNFYVHPTGSNNNDGLSDSTPFQTIQYACDQLRWYKFATTPINTVFINLADGTYIESVNLIDPNVRVIIRGNVFSPDNVQVIGNDTYTFRSVLRTNNWQLTGMTISNPSGSCIYITSNGYLNIGYVNENSIQFGTASIAHIEMFDGGKFVSERRYKVLSGSMMHILMDGHCYMNAGNAQNDIKTASFVNSPAFPSGTIVIKNNAYADFDKLWFTGSVAAGTKQYTISNNSMVYTNNRYNNFVGDIAGTIEAGGQFNNTTATASFSITSSYTTPTTSYPYITLTADDGFNYRISLVNIDGNITFDIGQTPV